MEPPLKPNESDCCNSGCNPCILDVYEELLQKYNSKILASSDINPRKNCLSPTTYSTFKLVKRIQYTPDTYLLTFQYIKHNPSDTVNDRLALIYKPGQHFLLKGHSCYDKDDQFTRAYTPIPVGHEGPLAFTIVAKLYEHGQMSKFFKRLRVNAETLWRGPYGSFKVNFSFQHMLLIAQGTGIAPIFAVVRQILDNAECETFLKLFFCCRTEQDILLRDEMYELSSFWNFEYEIFLSAPGNIQRKYNEVINAQRLCVDVIKMYMKDKVNADVQVLICGSEIFNQCMQQNVVDCGVDNSKIFLF